jgi:hypothetical protein
MSIISPQIVQRMKWSRSFCGAGPSGLPSRNVMPRRRSLQGQGRCRGRGDQPAQSRARNAYAYSDKGRCRRSRQKTPGVGPRVFAAPRGTSALSGAAKCIILEVRKEFLVPLPMGSLSNGSNQSANQASTAMIGMTATPISIKGAGSLPVRSLILFSCQTFKTDSQAPGAPFGLTASRDAPVGRTPS